MMGQRLVAAAVLLSVFAVGAMAGIAYERHHAAAPAAMATAAEVHDAAMAELQEVLGLDESQIEQVHGILAERQELVQHAWEQLRPELQIAMREIHVEIADLLRPEQRRLYHDWLSRQHDESQREGVLIIPH